MDVNAIQPGRDFRKAIDDSIHECSVLLAIVGRDWLESKDASGSRRLDDETDFVRLEIASLLSGGIFLWFRSWFGVRRCQERSSFPRTSANWLTETRSS